MTTIEINDEELEIEAEADDGGFDIICPQCNGTGEGQWSDSICHACHGSGVERDDSRREDYEADRADQINDERKLSGEWE